MSKRIEVKDLNVYYSKFKAVEDVNITIEPRTVTAFIDRAWTSALTLILMVMALNLLARLIARVFAPKLGR